MECILLIDFGSTYTKATAVDKYGQRIVCTARTRTTVETDIMVGYRKVLKALEAQMSNVEYKIVDCLVCSSAAGGLKMVASGLVNKLTAEAARLVCLGSGAKMMGVFSQKLTSRDVMRIEALDPDIILLAGGTDGGNHECIIHNAKKVCGAIGHIPYVAAGNKNAYDDLEAIFEENGVYYKITDNVMPELNQIQIEPARDAIRDIFMEKIIEAKGLGEAKEKLSKEIIPTPMAVLRATELLANGTDRHKGWGPLMVIDIGGATTDVHSAGDGYPMRSGVVLKGLVEPFLKRTVEGDLGMRVSAESLKESVGLMMLKELSGEPYEYIEERCRMLSGNIDVLADTAKEVRFDESLAAAAVKMAVERHAGEIESVYTPLGTLFYQTGKDLSSVNTVIGTGGVLVHSKNAERILEHCLLDEAKPERLRPTKSQFMVDTSYMLSAAGLLAKRYPELSFKLMDDYLKEAGRIEDEPQERKMV
jgi:uncharacterized protein (TIGR01319 family)